VELFSKVKYGKLLDVYSSLLTKKQVKQMEEYFLYDLSLTEIAENNHSTRQAVYDVIQKSTALLDEFENKIHVLEKFNNIEMYLDSPNIPGKIREDIKNILQK